MELLGVLEVLSHWELAHTFDAMLLAPRLTARGTPVDARAYRHGRSRCVDDVGEVFVVNMWTWEAHRDFFSMKPSTTTTC